MAVAGEDPQVKSYVTWAEKELENREVRGAPLDLLEGGRPELGRTLERAEKFLNLVALLAPLLSAVAVALAARGFAARLRHAARAGRGV
jgi:putative ABC transport system permease protein